MTTPELIAAIDRIRDNLAEARRYTRTDKAGTPGRVEGIVAAIRSLSVSCEGLTERLSMNLLVGSRAALVSPAVLEGAIDLASYELACLRGRLERAEGRDEAR